MRTRFLIVDDSDLVRQSLRTVLQANPEWEVSAEAANGSDAVERFKESHPNIVIVDFQMPGINGIETARRMMEIAPAVPIILFTQHASAELEKHALEAGIRKVVSKTDAFPMVGIIQALLGPGDPSPSLERPSQAEQDSSGKDR
ncbi:MAG TPA: response regulator transcription factor [Candidatus Acidoferrales bacterium]|nr:response regulator transcription factor [Candidatus Acidoferrales bacterium]